MSADPAPPASDHPSSSDPKTEASTATAAPALLSVGSFQSDPTEILEMEDWEVAPGRIYESIGDKRENIAFSKAYLSTNRAVPVCEDVTFRVDILYPAQDWQLEPDEDKTRVCSVATGKIVVKIGDEPWFCLGPHGMFRVKPGVTCKAQNQLYLESVLHVTSLAGFM